jgi:hypothetical protein
MGPILEDWGVAETSDFARPRVARSGVRWDNAIPALRLEVVYPLGVACRHPEMAEPEQISAVSSAQRYWWDEMWAGARPRFITTGTELIISVGLLLSLAIFYLFVRLLIFVGVPADSVKNLERIDFWFIYAVLVAFGVVFVFEAIIGAYSQITSSIKSAMGKN